MNTEFVSWEISGGIATVTLTREEKRNALNGQFVKELHQVFTELASNSDAKVIVLRSSGKAFSAGADLQYLQSLQTNTRQENVADSTKLMELFKQIYTHPKVVISMVDGPAIAGGCGLATVADYCFASTDSKFGYTESRIGFVPAIVMVFLLRKIGEGRAKEILLKGDVFAAERAKSLGLINEVVRTEELESYTYEFARSLIAKSSGESMGRIKQMISRIPELSLDEALTYAAEQNAETRESNDCKAGIAAFLNKDTISWN